MDKRWLAEKEKRWNEHAWRIWRETDGIGGWPPSVHKKLPSPGERQLRAERLTKEELGESVKRTVQALQMPTWERNLRDAFQ